MILATTTNDPTPADVNLGDLQSVWNVLRDAMEGYVETFVEQLPLYALAMVVFILGAFLIRQTMKGVDRGLARASVDPMVQTLTHQLLRAALLFGMVLLSLSVAGMEVGTALATLGLAGLAIAFALQNILENFIAGILILIRKPFKVGELVVTNGFEGIVEDINLRVTRLHDPNGVAFLIPNAQVFSNPITNLSELGRRRTSVSIGIDYRDDHTIVPELLAPVVAKVPGVLATPAADVLLTELGSSSVDFTIRFWTKPDPASIARVTSAVLAAAKSAVEEEGLTIPWPIRTLATDDHASLQRD